MKIKILLDTNFSKLVICDKIEQNNEHLSGARAEISHSVSLSIVSS